MISPSAAARAGDAGRGFAVVAHEVGAPAGQIAKATAEIGENVGMIHSRTRNAVETVRDVLAWRPLSVL
nr:methyl-accepting chemotaxis protein [Bradyrhizobium iriomotense]